MNQEYDDDDICPYDNEPEEGYDTVEWEEYRSCFIDLKEI
jgi:hypothetical protein